MTDRINRHGLFIYFNSVSFLSPPHNIHTHQLVHPLPNLLRRQAILFAQLDSQRSSSRPTLSGRLVAPEFNGRTGLLKIGTEMRS